MPGAPTRPRVVNVTDTGVTLVWEAPSHPGNRPLMGYRVSVFTAGWSGEKSESDNRRSMAGHHQSGSSRSRNGWIPIHKPIIDPKFYIELIKNHPRLVVVRAFNTLGDSEPSPWSPLLTSPSISDGSNVRTERAGPLIGTLVNLTSVAALPPDALRITWRVSLL